MDPLHTGYNHYTQKKPLYGVAHSHPPPYDDIAPAAANDKHTNVSANVSASTEQQHATEEDSLPASTEMTHYNMYYTTSRMNVRLHQGPSTIPAKYYVETKISLRKPQLLLRKGADKAAPVVAFSKIAFISRQMLIGKGDCSNETEDDLVWEDFTREKNVLHRSDYHFSTDVGSDTGKRKNYTWKKNKTKLLRTVYEAFDESGTAVGTMLSGGMFNFNKGGEVQVLKDLDQDLQELLLVSAAAIFTVEALDGRTVFKGY